MYDDLSDTATVEMRREDFYDSPLSTSRIGKYLPDHSPWVIRSAPEDGVAARVRTVPVLKLESPHHWHLEAARHIKSLACLGSDWHETPADPPNEESVGLSQAVLNVLSDLNFEPARIDPTSVGGICFSFEQGDRYADIECLNSGNMVALLMEGSNNPIVSVVTAADIPDTVAKLNGFIRR